MATPVHPTYPRPNQLVDAPCWCECTMQFVPIEDVRRGLTKPCDDPMCRYQDRKARAAT